MSGEKKDRTMQKITFKIFIVARSSSLSKNGSARSDLHAYFRFVTVLYWVVSDPATRLWHAQDKAKSTVELALSMGYLEQCLELL